MVARFSLVVETKSVFGIGTISKNSTGAEFPNTPPPSRQLEQIGQSALDATGMPSKAKIWLLRILVIAGIISLCLLAGSSDPAFALALIWGPNGLFLLAYTKGTLRFPRFLERVHHQEPMLYRRIGVRVVKRLVATHEWPMMLGFEPSVKPRSRREFMERLELEMKGAEVCHGATFVLASFAIFFYLSWFSIRT